MPPVDEVIKTVAKRKGITLSEQDLTTIVLGVANGSAPPTGSKRTRSTAAAGVACDNSVTSIDLLNGTTEPGAVSNASSPASSITHSGVGPEGDSSSPPPRKKQLISGAAVPSTRSESSNGLLIVTDDEQSEGLVQTGREAATTTS
ncbi:unnamed protein product [Echinostoma caproni]|uniref:DEK_C domain-containing protein n=1 Tax=Echinostoma caproni TaxID=27848 RepID=A0A183AU68_9TREM|nr:unnamed protein product [Echinostoma caproni]